jgi:formylmethanofuran dehydrogenase subunit E
MKQEHREAIRQLAATGQSLGPAWDETLQASFLVHGHICGGMPLGFRAGATALEALGTEREANMAHLVFVETGTGHAAGCFADGVQMATGCTFGKGLMERTEYGKWALSLVHRKTRRAVRVSVRPEVMKAALQSPFVKMRHQGVAPTEVPLDVSRPLVQGLMARAREDLFRVSDPFEYPLSRVAPACFDAVICASCGELVAENKIRMKEGRPMCLPCTGYGVVL